MLISWSPLLALFGPFFSSLFLLLTHKRISYIVVSAVTVGSLIFSLCATVFCWYFVSSVAGVIFFDFAEIFQKYWYCSNWIQLTANFIFDEICLMMFLLVISVSLCVHIYSIEYMHQDPDRNIFFAYLSLFTFFMLLLVSSGNLIQFFIGWEGVGMCSYLLINFWYMRIEANKAAIKAVVVNKIGDCAFLIATGLLYSKFKTLNIVTLTTILSRYADLNFVLIDSPFAVFVDYWTLVTFFFLLAVMGKSAQIGFHTWLPDAMEGPTPVSALIHAATLVTAGIFLIIRFSPLFDLAPVILQLMSFIGGITALWAARMAYLQCDVKKAIAYSTCSQLGYMLVGCGLSQYSFAFFHLFVHGFFKALLFLCAGAILHGTGEDQDIRQRYKGTLINSELLVGACALGFLGLGGFPFIGSYYTKDLIILSAIYEWSTYGWFLYILLVAGACYTAMYSTTIMCTCLLTPVSSKHSAFHSLGIFISIPLFFLSLGTLFLGYVFCDYFTVWINNFEGPDGYWERSLPFWLEGFMLYLGVSLGEAALSQAGWCNKKNKWFDITYNNSFLKPVFHWCYKVFYLLDGYLFELFGPRGIIYLLLRAARSFTFLQTGSIFFYLILIIVGGLGTFCYLG